MIESQGKNRPISPHLTIYKPQYTSVLSILHRITGLALIASLFVVIFWFLSIAFGEKYYVWYLWFISSFPIQTIMILSIWAIWYHTCNGVRHLLWDIGLGLEIRWIRPSSIAVLVLSTILSACTILVGWLA